MNRTRRNRKVFFVLIGLFVILGCRSCVPTTMEFDKVAEPSVFTGPGEVITYSYVVKNTNGLPLIFSITDDKLGVVPCQSTSLGAGGVATCQISYTTTEADVAAGVIRNTATAKGVIEDPEAFAGWITFEYSEAEMTDSAEVVYELPKCQLDIKKSANPTMYTAAGNVIEYTYEIHNVGYGNISGPFTVVDNRVDEWSCDDGGAASDLCVDCYITCRGSYTIKESDVGSNITNEAHVQGVCSANNMSITSNTSTATVYYLVATPTSQAVQPQLTVKETVDPAQYSKAGILIIQNYEVQNTGLVDVQGPFKLVDDKVDEWECDETSILSAGGQITCKGYYMVKSSDVGSDITNEAHVEGVYPGGAVVSNTTSAIVFFEGAKQPPPPGENPPPSNPPIIICDQPWCK